MARHRRRAARRQSPAVVLVGAGVLLFARARVGGFTGDVLGAAILLGETVGLLVAGARW